MPNTATAARQTKRPVRDGARTRARILKEATKLIAERGYRSTTMKAVAESVGVTEPAVYRHFPGKEQLLLAVFSDTVDRTLHDARIESTTRAIDPLTHQLVLLTRPENATLRRLIAEMYAAAAIEPEVGALARNFVNRATESLHSRLAAAVKEGDVSPDLNLSHARAAIFIFMTGLAHHETLAADLIGDQDWEDFIVGTLKRVLRG